MKRLGFKSRRSLRSEILPVVLVFAIPVVALMDFPLRALSSPRGLGTPPCAPACAFVRLTPEEESAIVKRARSSWKVDNAAVRNIRLDLLTSALPEERDLSIIKVDERAPVRPDFFRPPELSLLPRGHAAMPPEPLPSAGPKPEIAPGSGAPFSLQQLLEIPEEKTIPIKETEK